MKNYILLIVNILVAGVFINAQDVGVSGTFYANVIPENHTSTLVVLFNNNSFSTLNEAYIVADFPVNGEYSTPTNPPSGPGAQYFNWTLYANTWTGILNTPRPGNNVDSLLFTVQGMVETTSVGVSTLLFVDIINGSDNNTMNNNAAPVLVVDNSALPVDLQSFEGYSEECGVNRLEWIVNSEVNNMGFEIMRSSDGNVYETLGFVKGQVFNSEVTTYTYTDELSDRDVYKGFYYKFRQIDFDGQFEFSPEVFIKSKCEDQELTLDVFPNPTNDYVNFSFNKKLESELQVSLITIDGKTYNEIILEDNSDSFSLSLAHLSEGIYYVRISTSGFTTTKKLMIVR